jgi:hypothetical protein
VEQTLHTHVVRVYGALLEELALKHAGYTIDTSSFGNEIDRYANASIQLEFYTDRSGEEFVRILLASHPTDVFDLGYLVEMLTFSAPVNSNLDALKIFSEVAPAFYAMPMSEYYSCYRRSYRCYENCRNFIGIKTPDGKRIIAKHI